MSVRQRLGVMLATLAVATIALPAVSEAQPNAFGGGCETLTGVRPCVAATGTSMPLTLHGDFYLTDFSFADPGGVAALYICIGFDCQFQYDVATSFLGHYPEATRQTGVDAGNGDTQVDIFDSSLVFLGTRVSPT